MLREASACEETVAALEAEWPNGTIVTKAVCLRAAELKADFDWAAENLLSDTAREAYQKAMATAREALQKATAPALEAYQKAMATALEAYQKATAPAWEAYHKATATAFWQAWRMMEIEQGAPS
jgi:hypothetical protein